MSHNTYSCQLFLIKTWIAHKAAKGMGVSCNFENIGQIVFMSEGTWSFNRACSCIFKFKLPVYELTALLKSKWFLL